MALLTRGEESGMVVPSVIEDLAPILLFLFLFPPVMVLFTAWWIICFATVGWVLDNKIPKNKL